MKFANENAIRAIAGEGLLTKEGRLFHRKNMKKSFKPRWFKLKSNLFYYYRTNEYGNVSEDEPLGLLVLASCSVRMDFLPDAPYVFSILFHFSNERHYFCGVNTDECIEWVDALQCASYNTMRDQYESLKKEIALRGENEIVNTPKSALFHRRIGKSFNTALPRRYEKRFQSTDRLRHPRDRSLDQIRKSVPHEKGVHRSGGALEQVRKSYSLANLMVNEETGELYYASSNSTRTPSASLLDDNKKNNFFNFEFRHFESKKKKRNKMKKQPSEGGVTYKHHSHNYRNSTYDIRHNENTYLLPTSLTSRPFTSTSTERIDFIGRKKNKKQPKRKSIDQQQIMTNEQFQMLKQTFNKNFKPYKIKNSKISQNESSSLQLDNQLASKIHTKQNSKPNDETLGIILEPLSLASNPFLSTYSMSVPQEKHIEKKKFLLRHGYSVIERKHNSKSKVGGKKDHNNNEEEGDEEDNLSKFIQRPRSCTLAQLEKIPNFLKQHSNHECQDSNEAVDDDEGDGHFERSKDNIFRNSLNFPLLAIPRRGHYDIKSVNENDDSNHVKDDERMKTSNGVEVSKTGRKIILSSPPKIRQKKNEWTRLD